MKLAIGTMVCLLLSIILSINELNAQEQEVELSPGGVQCHSIDDCWINDRNSTDLLANSNNDSLLSDDMDITEDNEQANRYRAIVTAKITAYCLRGITRSGTYTTYGTVATDRRYIAQHARMEIDGLQGVYTSLDTGLGVIGWHVDVWMDNCWSAKQWGVRYKEVRILE